MRNDNDLLRTALELDALENEAPLSYEAARSADRLAAWERRREIFRRDQHLLPSAQEALDRARLAWLEREVAAARATV